MNESAPKDAPGTQPPSSVRPQYTEPVILGDLIPSAVLAAIVSEELAKGAIGPEAIGGRP